MFGLSQTEILTSTSERKRLNLSSSFKISPIVLSANQTKADNDSIKKYIKYTHIFISIYILVTLTYLFITKGFARRQAGDWLVDDVYDPIGCWYILLDDREHSAGVVHEDELLCQTKPMKMKVPESSSGKSGSMQQPPGFLNKDGLKLLIIIVIVVVSRISNFKMSVFPLKHI